MKDIRAVAVSAGVLTLSLAAAAAPVVVVSQGEEADLPALYSSVDLVQGLIATELPGDRGWHSLNTEVADQLPAFTDGIGLRATGLTGLLNDFPPDGTPTKRIEYALPSPADLAEVRVFSGNDGRDGRVFHSYTVSFSTNSGQTFSPPIYVQSHPSGTINNGGWRVVLSQLRDSAGPLAQQVTHLRFDFYAADNSQGECRDPFEMYNPFTGMDDGYNAPNTSPLIWEIDVLATPIVRFSRSTTQLFLTWLAQPNNFVVQGNTNLDSAGWADLVPPPPIQSSGPTNTATIPIGPGSRFFRLRN